MTSSTILFNYLSLIANIFTVEDPENDQDPCCNGGKWMGRAIGCFCYAGLLQPYCNKPTDTLMLPCYKSTAPAPTNSNPCCNGGKWLGANRGCLCGNGYLPPYCNKPWDSGLKPCNNVKGGDAVVVHHGQCCNGGLWFFSFCLCKSGYTGDHCHKVVANSMIEKYDNCK